MLLSSSLKVLRTSSVVVVSSSVVAAVEVAGRPGSESTRVVVVVGSRGSVADHRWSPERLQVQSLLLRSRKASSPEKETTRIGK